jgi:hypothetical protein
MHCSILLAIKLVKREIARNGIEGEINGKSM